MGGWMGLSGHRANILNGSYRLLGVGAAQSLDGRWYAAQVFGAVSACGRRPWFRGSSGCASSVLKETVTTLQASPRT